jgi:ParB-like chromosome segregation protein Spo0J
MKVELIEISRVVPYARNPRRNENAIAKVAASIKEFGFRQPIVVDEEMVIIAGHTRLQAAIQLGLKKVPVHIATGLTQAQLKAYRLADNRTHEDSEWDEELLAIELGELDELGFDLDLTGFEAIELDKLLADADMGGATDDDAVPAIPETAVTKEGDIWLLGDHKLLCGDSTKAASLKTLMGDELADMVFTDPPYNVDYGQSIKDSVRGNKRKIKNDNLGDVFQQFLTDACKEMVKVCKGALYIACLLQNCTRFSVHSKRLAVNGQPLSSGAKTISLWGVLIISASTNLSFTAGRKAQNISGAVRGIRATCGVTINRKPMTCTRL